MDPSFEATTLPMERVDFVASAEFTIKTLYFLGSWVTPSSTFQYKLYAFIAQIFGALTFAINVNLMLPGVRDLENLMWSMPISLTMLGYWTKLSNLYVRRHEVQEFFNLLNSDDSQVDTYKELMIVKRANKYGKKLTYIWFWLFLTAGLSALVTMMSSEPKVPYPIYYPDWRDGPRMFYASCVYQTFCIIHGSLVNQSSDALLPCFLTVLTGQIDALGWRLENLRKLSEPSNGNEALIRKEFVNCVRRHKHLLKLSLRLQNMFSFVTFFQMCLAGIIVCGLIFQLSLLSPLDDPKMFFKLLSFASAIFLQVFLPCFTAYNVRIASQALNLKMYSADWIGLSQPLKRMIIIFMQRLQYPILITVGGIIFLGMENFMVVLKYSYSLYSLLRKVQSK